MWPERLGALPRNYDYDPIGNLTQDVRDSIDHITWTNHQKIRVIEKTDRVIRYRYNPMQQRMAKYVRSGDAEKRTYYVRDVQGNVMAAYSAWMNLGAGVTWDSFALSEQHIYGSSRVGYALPGVKLHPETPENPHALDSCHYLTFEGWKRYEISNHLGNVLAVISDRQHGKAVSGTDIQWFEAEVLSAQQYYPFGMLMPGDTSAEVRRQYSLGGYDYRFGFTGGEKIDEIANSGNFVDLGERGVDTRLGRLNWQPDPDFYRYPYLSPYAYAANSPIRFIDVKGKGPGDVVIVFAGADLAGDGGLGSAKGIVDNVNLHDFNKNGGYANAFASKYWGISMKSTKDLDIATQTAYEAIKANYNIHNGENVENGKVIIYGYSWGGVLAQHLTDRLKNDEINVDLLITIDAAAGPESKQVDRTISENVKENLNVFQRNRSSIGSRGDKNTADNAESTNVVNRDYTNYYIGKPGQSDYQKVEHSTIDEITRPRVISKILETVKKTD